MDCEKFDTLLLDELYGELDELTSAAVKRHVAGCSRCSGLLGGMKATRRLAVLPVLAAPEGLEERILGAAREAQKVVPFASRFSRAISTAGSWAMRPQTQMAALFLLMIGSGTLFLRGRHDKAQSAAVTVTDEGAPMASVAVAQAVADAPMDPRAASNAHGLQPLAPVPAATMAPPAASGALAAVDEDQLEKGERDTANGPMEKALGGADKERKKKDGDLSALGNTTTASLDDARNASAPAGAPMTRPPSPSPRAAPKRMMESDGNADPYAAAGGGGFSQQMPAKTTADPDGFSGAMAQYRGHAYTEATRRFDVVAQSNGDNNAALWAARSTREGTGCSNAVSRFDAISNRAWGTAPGYEATLDAGNCYAQLGQYDMARARLTRLLNVSAYAQRAQSALDNMSQVATRQKAAAHAAAERAAPAPPPQAAPPAQPPAADAAKKPAAAAADSF